MPSLLSADNAPRTVLNLTDLIDRVRGDLGLRDSSLLTDTDIIAWLYAAQTRIATETHWFRLSTTMGTTAGTKEYSLPLPTTGRCIQIEEIRYDTTQLDAITLEQLLALDWNYRDAGNGKPWLYYVRGNNGFGLHLTPDTTDIDILLIQYVGIPPRVTATLDFLYVPHGGDEALITYAKVLASQKDAYGEGANRIAMYKAEWEAHLAQLKRQINKVAERVPAVMGGEALDAERPRRRVPWHTSVTSP